MELKSSAINSVLRNKSVYPNHIGSHSKELDSIHQQPPRDWLSFLFDGSIYRNYYVSRFRKLFKGQEMAEVKMGWIILNMLGVPIYILGIVNNLDNYKSAVLFFMGLLYSVTVLMRSYEKWRKEKIANDRDLFHLENEKARKIKTKHP